MKKFFLMMALLACSIHGVCIAGVPATFSEEDSFERDTVRAARAYAEAFWDDYKISLTFYDSSGSRWQHMELTANLDRHITSVTLDGEVILSEGETVLPGIPIPEGGMHQVYAFAGGYRGEEQMVYGHVFLPLVNETNPLALVLRPMRTARYIPYDVSEIDLPEGVRPESLRLTSENGQWIGYYNTAWRGFIMWIDRSISPISVTVTSSERYDTRYDSFILDPFVDDVAPVGASSVNFGLMGNVHRFVLDEGQQPPYLQMSSVIDGLAEINEETFDGFKDVVQAKSFIFENRHGWPLEFSVYGALSRLDGRLRVSAYWVTGGEMQLVHQVYLAPNGQPGMLGATSVYGSVQVPAGTQHPTSVIFVVESIVGQAIDTFEFTLATRSGVKG